MHEAIFRLAGTEGYAALTREFDARLSLWCNDHSDLLQVRCSSGDAADVLERIDAIAGVDDALVEETAVVAVTDGCIKDHDTPTVDPHLDAHGCLLLPPLTYENGARLCRVLALDADRLTACYRSLLEAFDVTVDAKRTLEVLPSVQSPFDLERNLPELTSRQREVFVLAYERGYYELPRETTMVDIAATLEIDRRTAEEHRRRAERKLLGALARHRLA
ncbi:helix-turn-helix domain-containing protein [Natrononativus amylolyticus]|uniref:helix-turn-helix domain-containing protein n=1 Tax=Natrononativus amylolyticus TaxID=2963434 RepID=UPI0020CFE479|nr:helix-turn-helix domain-containing protein [Natrononativus amylolyticus]